MKRVVIIGGGNLAESVAVAIAASPKVELAQIYLRSKSRGEELTALTSTPHKIIGEPIESADIYLLAVSDSAISELSQTINFPEGAVVAHTAGSTSIEAIDEGLNRAVFYPLQTFTKGRRVDFSKIPIFIEASNAEALEDLRELGEQLSDSVQCADSEQRRALHLSAVFVCNFVNAMFIAGEEIVSSSALPFETLKPLIEECCAKAIDVGSPRKVQTGPAVRGDQTTMLRHCEMLQGREDLKMIYQNISKYIWETSKRI